MDAKQIVLYEDSLSRTNNEIAEIVDLEVVELVSTECADFFPQSDMDGWDYLVCTSSAAASVFLTTNEEFEKWLAGVHDAANKQSGDYDFAQRVLGALFEHKGDYMDRMSTRFEGDDDPWRVFHRLFYGHDPLSLFAENPDNPFALMVEQKGLFGILQVVRHLIADTFSKQGLPFPGHAVFEYAKEGNRPWSHLLDLVQELSTEAYGNKVHAEQIYEHLLTIRAQDIAGGMLQVAAVNGYLRARGITDDVRTSQVRLTAYSMGFFSQAIAGSLKQNGVPYINAPLATAMAKALASLLLASNKRTLALERESNELLARSSEALGRHERLKAVLSDDIRNCLPKGEKVE